MQIGTSRRASGPPSIGSGRVATGTRASTTVPRPGVEVIVSVPSSESMRSRMLMSPSPPSRPLLKPRPSSAMRSSRIHSAYRQARRAPSWRHCGERIAERFLDDAEQAEGGALGQCAAAPPVVELHGEALARHLSAMPADGRDEPERLHLRRVQPVRNRVHVAGDLGGAAPRLLEGRQERVDAQRRVHGEPLQVDGQRASCRLEMIVQFARDAAALVVLRRHQPVGQGAEQLLGFLALGDVTQPPT